MDIDLDAIRARVDAAAPGPWFTGARGLHPWEVCVDWNRPQIEMEDTKQGIADAEFIAHARQDIPALLALVDSLVKKLADADLVIVSMRSAIDEADAADEFDAVYTPARPIDADAPTQVIRLDGSWPA